MDTLNQTKRFKSIFLIFEVFLFGQTFIAFNISQKENKIKVKKC